MNPKVVTCYVNFPRGVTLAYDLHLGHTREHWKGLIEENNVKRDYTIPLAIFYPKHDLII